jgi:hypothetical protein
MEITKREILVSICIIAILLILGVWIGGCISDACADRDAIYNKALKIDSADLFEYGMRTNVGNAFVYGDLKTVDTVTFPEIDGEYMRVKKVTERYTRHTRTVAKTRTVNGKTQTYTETEVYWSWDEIDRETRTCKEITFLGVPFSSNKICIPTTGHLKTIKESSRIRYQYYGTGTEYVGTIFTDLRDGTIEDGTEFYKDRTIDETVESLKSANWILVFWIVWIVVIVGCVVGFYYIDNWWLE